MLMTYWAQSLKWEQIWALEKAEEIEEGFNNKLELLVFSKTQKNCLNISELCRDIALIKIYFH